MKNVFKIFSFVLCLFLTGCSALRSTYDYADRLILWQLDDYFDLESEQKDALLIAIRRNLEQHRLQELPKYPKLIRSIQEVGNDGLTAEEIQQTFQEFGQLYENIVRQLLPDAALLLSGLSQEQILHFQEVLKEENDEIAEPLEDSLEEQEKDYEERVLENSEEWLGDLSDEQEELLKKKSKEWYNGGEGIRKRLESRKNFQSRLFEFLQTQPDAQKTEVFLGNLLQEQYSDDSDDSDASENSFIQGILEIDQLVTPEQRLYASQQLDEYAGIIEEILEEYKE